MKCFGLNSNGETGIKNFEKYKINVLYDYKDIDSIYCGAHHTIIKTGLKNFFKKLEKK